LTLPRAARLRHRDQFSGALAAGAVGIRRHFALYARSNGLGQARIGIIAGRRAVRNAVDRNRARRWVREAFRLNRHRFGGVDVVVQVRRCPPRDGAAAARTELAKLFGELDARLRERGI